MTYNHHSSCPARCYETEMQHARMHAQTHRGHNHAPDVINYLFMFLVTYNHTKMYHGHICANILLYQNCTMHITYKALITPLNI